MTKPIYILGTGLSHDGSTCLMKDGKIIFAIEKERITRLKHDGFNDNLTIDYCLKAEGIDFEDLDLIVQENTSNEVLKPEEITKRSNRQIPTNIPIVTISHHLAHAYSAVGTSNFDEMSVIVIDGQGSSMDTCTDLKNCITLPLEFKNITIDQYKFWEFLSFYSFKNGKLQTIFKDFALFYMWDRENCPVAPEDMLHSIGEFYEGISNYIFDKSFCEGKTMGLASYSQENTFDFEAFDLSNDRIKLRTDWMNNFPKYNSGKYLGFAENFQYYADIAYWAQKQLEKAVIKCFDILYNMAPSDNVAYAGGVALNAVLNSKILSNVKFKNLYIQPAAGDNGLAIGCCYYGWLEYFGKERVYHNSTTYLGKCYSNPEIIRDLNKFADKILFVQDENYIKSAANLLNEGKVIGWFQKGSEFGPRALGHRSILADPRRRDVRNFINRKIKTREDFRPFAPSILKEELHDYFECDFDESDYMLKVAKARSDLAQLIPGVIHKDLSARVQTVDKNLAPEYFELISEFKTLSGLPIVLNTSFNGVNMPIVETPFDAIEFFVNIKNIDVLFINNIAVQLKK